MSPVRKIKEWLFGIHERKEEKQMPLKHEAHLHPHEHQVTVYEEKPPALLHLKKKKSAQAKKTAKGKSPKIHSHRKLKELKTMATKKPAKKAPKGKKKKR